MISEYLARESVLTPPGQTVDLTGVRRRGSGVATFTGLTFDGGDGDAPVHSGGPLHARLEITAEESIVTDSIAVTVSDRTGFRLVNADTIRLDRPVRLEPGPNVVELTVKAIHLNPGTYSLGLRLARWPETVFDTLDAVCDIEVVPDPRDGTVRPATDGAVRCEVELRTEGPAG